MITKVNYLQVFHFSLCLYVISTVPYATNKLPSRSYHKSQVKVHSAQNQPALQVSVRSFDSECCLFTTLRSTIPAIMSSRAFKYVAKIYFICKKDDYWRAS